jgi:hypothetical protein
VLRTSSSDYAPRPISATVSASTSVYVLKFDVELVTGVRDRFNWSWDLDITGPDLVFTPNAPMVVNSFTITGILTPSGSGVGGPTVTYTPPPFDIVGTNGKPMAAFAGLPVTILP